MATAAAPGSMEAKVVSLETQLANVRAQADADAVFAAGWDERALHDAIAVTARMGFMQRLVEGHGFTPWSPEKARTRAEKRVELGYVNLYPAFAGRGGS